MKILPSEPTSGMLNAGWGICREGGQPDEALIAKAKASYAALLESIREPASGNDTPLTDGNRESYSLIGGELFMITVPKTFARKLERRLNHALAEIQTLKNNP